MRIKLALSLFMIVMISGCYKDPLYNELSSNFTVSTNRDLAANYNSYKTYHISDTIAFLNNSSQDSMIVGNDAKLMVDAVKNNLNARGYTYVSRNSKPDLGISMIAIKNVQAGVIYPGWWYGGYYGWWGGYWGGYYPYYPYGVPYVVTSGNVVIDMLDLKNAPTEEKYNVLWTAWVGGGLATTTSVNIQLSVDAINQAFVQSPYINANQ